MLDTQNLAMIVAAVCGTVSIVVTITAIGIQYGIYTSFKHQSEATMEEFKIEIRELQESSKNQDVKYATLLTKVDGLETRIQENFNRIFEKLNSYDETLRNWLTNITKGSSDK